MSTIINFVKKHKVVTGIIIYAISMIIIMLIVFVLPSSNRQNTDIPGVWTEETVDPASREIVVDTNYNGLEDGFDNVITPGFNHLYEIHTDAWVSGVASVIKLYARQQNTELERISLVKDSVKEHSEEDPADRNNGFLITNFTVVLNVDQTKLNIMTTFDNSGLAIKIFTKDGAQIANYKVNTDDRYVIAVGSIPAYLNPGPTVFKTYAQDDLPQIAADIDLPPIKEGDKVRAYFGCPLPKQITPEGCFVYKYDFYY